MKRESCRDCTNFEDRRSIEGVAICAMHHGPSVCCPEFTPRNAKNNPERLYNRFCLKCANFENVNGVVVCARHHRPGIACGAFRKREEDTKGTKINRTPMSITV